MAQMQITDKKRFHHRYNHTIHSGFETPFETPCETPVTIGDCGEGVRTIRAFFQPLE